VQLADLLHCESLPLQAALLDVHLSGYIGDVVCGTTYDGVVDPTSLMMKLPFSGVSIGWNWDRAIEWCEEAVGALSPSAPRYAIYEHKFTQAIHPIFQSYAPYVRVRAPFTDYALFDFFASLSQGTRAWLYPAWLAKAYPAFFRAIPDQSTGLPVTASAARIVTERGRRGARRVVSAALGRIAPRLSPPPRVRAYHDEHGQWSQPSFRARIEGEILRQGSLCLDVFDRGPLTAAVREFFELGRGPVQFVGALYAFEMYHRDLADHLRTAARAAEKTRAAFAEHATS
jgi:hypothetical protein